MFHATSTRFSSDEHTTYNREEDVCCSIQYAIPTATPTGLRYEQIKGGGRIVTQLHLARLTRRCDVDGRRDASVSPRSMTARRVDIFDQFSALHHRPLCSLSTGNNVSIQRKQATTFYRAMLCIRGTSHGPVSVCHKSVFYRNSRTNRAGFWHVSFLPPVLHGVKRKFGYLQK